MIVLAPDFMTKIGKKAAQDFFCAVSKVYDRVKTVALWSAKKKEIKRTIKGYGSAANWTPHIMSADVTKCFSLFIVDVVQFHASR